MMSNARTINFVDEDSWQPGRLTVRVERGTVGMGLSLRDDRDVEVFLRGRKRHRSLSALPSATAGCLPRRHQHLQQLVEVFPAGHPGIAPDSHGVIRSPTSRLNIVGGA